MIKFYRGEVTTSLGHTFTCYIKGINSTSAENHLMSYYEDNCSRELGGIESVSIISINPSEYYGIKKISKSTLFI